MSINKEFVFNSKKLEIKIKCAEELIGKNSDIPWTAERMNISINF